MPKNSLEKGILLGFCCFWLVAFWTKFDIPVDEGDGLMHHFIAKASWQDPNQFLNHWGKPFYILLSSTFAQVGMLGSVLFNVVIFAMTIFFGWKILDYFRTPFLLQSLLPFFLILTKDYSETVIGGLTEPLFNFMLVLATWLFVQKKYGYFAIIIGLLPFCRSEGLALLPIALVLLTLCKAPRSLPLLFLPFLIYSLLGLFVYDDFWWYFTKSPYSMENDLYGKGTWAHYFDSYKNYLGNHGLFTVIFGLFAFVLVLVKKGFLHLHWLFLVLCLGPFIIIFSAHVYFWAKGLNGAYGLTRLTTQGMPSLLIGSFYLLGLATEKLSFPRYLSWICLPLLAYFSIKQFDQKIEITPFNQAVLKSASFLQKTIKPTSLVLYHHPLIAYKLGFNPVLPNESSRLHYQRSSMAELKKTMRYGDVVVWDSNFGPQEMCLPFDSLKLDSEFMLIDLHETKGVISPSGVFTFQYVPKKYKAVEETRSSKIIFDAKLPPSTDEFYPIFNRKDLRSPFRFEVSFSGEGDQLLVIATKNAVFYKTVPLTQPDTLRFYFQNEEELTVYIWNQSRKPLQNSWVKVEEFNEKIGKPYSSK